MTWSTNAQWAIVALLALLAAIEACRGWIRYQLSKPPLSIPPR